MSQKRREGVRPPLAAPGHLYKKSVLGFENKYGSGRGSPRSWALEGEAARRLPRVLSSRCPRLRGAAAGPCWLRAWRAARGGPCAAPQGCRGSGRAREAPSGPCCRLHWAVWAAWQSAGGCARPRSACGCLGHSRGAIARARRRRPPGPRPEGAPPQMPRAAGGVRRALPAWYVPQRTGSEWPAVSVSVLDLNYDLWLVRVGLFRCKTFKPFSEARLRAS